MTGPGRVARALSLDTDLITKPAAPDGLAV
jgi:hypothetical protein